MKNIGLMIYAINSGGAERVVSHLSHILSKSYNVHVILFEDTYMEYECGGTVHSLNVPTQDGSPLVKIKLLLKRIRALKALIRKEQLDCVISFLDSPNFVNLFSGVKGCRKIISIRNYSGLENRQSTLGKITDIAMKMLYRKADCVVTVSKLIQQDFMEHYGISKNKITTVYNPYNFEEMWGKGKEPLSEDEQSFFSKHFMFANVGRIMHQKGVWHLVKAFSLVRKEHSEAGLVLVGEDLSDGKLTELINSLGLNDSILLTGRTRNPYKYMSNSQSYVLTSLFEGFPNAMVESMACGCAVIATDCKSGPREILFENPDINSVAEGVCKADSGLIIPPLEDEENWSPDVITVGEKNLAEAMLSVMESPELQKELSEKALCRSKAFDYSAARDAFEKIIENVYIYADA